MKPIIHCLLILFIFPLITHAESPSKTTIVILGDSITEGYGIEKKLAYPSLAQARLLADGKNIEIINAGISGSTTSSGPSRIKWLVKTKPNILFLALGANDGLRGVSLELTKANLKETIAIAKKNKIRVWIAGMKMPPNYGKTYTTDFIKMFEDVAKEEKVPLYPFLLEGVAGNPKLNQPDGIHPNEDGHIVIADKIAKFIKELL